MSGTKRPAEDPSDEPAAKRPRVMGAADMSSALIQRWLLKVEATFLAQEIPAPHVMIDLPPRENGWGFFSADPWYRETLCPVLQSNGYDTELLVYRHPELDADTCQRDHCSHTEHWQGRRLSVWLKMS